MSRVDRIRERLEAEFAPTALSVRDDSHKHIGHAGAQSGMGHFHVHIESDRFRAIPMLKRHQMVFAALDDMMRSDIHALSLETAAPDKD